MSSRLIDTLENHGLVSSEAVQRLILDLPFQQVVRIREEIEASVGGDSESHADANGSLSSFNLLASASLRGDSGCGSPSCRVQKARALARYSALFCDRLLLPLNLGSHGAVNQLGQRSKLIGALLSLTEMRPVIDAGIVVPVLAQTYFCPHCSPQIGLINDRLLEVKNELVREVFDQFSLTYDPMHQGEDLELIIKGPERYLEHGEMLATFQRSSATGFSLTGEMRVLSDDEKRASGVIDNIVSAMARDVGAQQIYGTQFNVAYLTDRGGEAEVLARLDANDQLAARTAVLSAQLMHSVPLFMDLSLCQVMRIRNEDYAAFASYRAALGRILSDHVNSGKELTTQEAKDLYRDVLEPEILSLEQQARNERRTSLKGSLVRYGAAAGAIAFGAYTGLLPADLVKLFAAVGGVSLVTNLAESVASIQKNPPKVRNSNLYFLLRLQQESGR
jgi:hypothetical protein